MSVPGGWFVCPLCEQRGGSDLPLSEVPVCRSTKHLKPVVMVRVVATAAERQQKSRRRKRKVNA